VTHFIGIGHSHLQAVTFGWNKFMVEHPGMARYTPIQLLDAALQPSFSIQDSKWVPNPAWHDKLRANLQDDDVTVFVSFEGAQHFSWSFTPGPNPFDFVDAVHDDGAPLIGQLVPYELVMRVVRAPCQGMRKVVEAIRDVAPVPIVLLVAPPPVRDLESLIAANPWMRKQLPELMRQGDEFGVSPVGFRVKLWRVYVRVLTEIAAELGIECQIPPQTAFDEIGALRADMIHDILHGNAIWGSLMVRQLLSRAGVLQEAV
jgi:hypothetical protein